MHPRPATRRLFASVCGAALLTVAGVGVAVAAFRPTTSARLVVGSATLTSAITLANVDCKGQGNSSSADVTWTSPPHPDGALRSQTLRITDSNGTLLRSVDAPQNPYTYTFGKTRTFTVTLSSTYQHWTATSGPITFTVCP